MKKALLIKQLREIARERGVEFVFVREGGNHEVWRLGVEQVAIPRHRDVREPTARRIIRDARIGKEPTQ